MVDCNVDSVWNECELDEVKSKCVVLYESICLLRTVDLVYVVADSF